MEYKTIEGQEVILDKEYRTATDSKAVVKFVMPNAYNDDCLVGYIETESVDGKVKGNVSMSWLPDGRSCILGEPDDDLCSALICPWEQEQNEHLDECNCGKWLLPFGGEPIYPDVYQYECDNCDASYVIDLRDE